MSLGHWDPTIGVLFIDFYYYYLFTLFIKISSISNLSLSSHSRMIASEYPVLNFFARMHACMKAENTLIFFPMIRKTKVILPKSLFSARLMHRIVHLMRMKGVDR